MQLIPKLRHISKTHAKEQIFPIDKKFLQALITCARDKIHFCLKDYREDNKTADKLVGLLEQDGHEIPLDDDRKMLLKLALPNSHQAISSVSYVTTLINIGGGTLQIELFKLNDLNLSFLRSCTLEYAQGIILASADIAYRISPDNQTLVVKFHDDTCFDYGHYFAEDKTYQCSIPVDFNIYSVFYMLCATSSLGKLDDILNQYKDTLLAGPVAFLWETAKFLIHRKHKACYLFLDEIVARNDSQFAESAQQTRNNIQEFI